VRRRHQRRRAEQQLTDRLGGRHPAAACLVSTRTRRPSPRSAEMGKGGGD
jgi:hypothetical protein